jgi:hypothetical protein
VYIFSTTEEDRENVQVSVQVGSQWVNAGDVAKNEMLVLISTGSPPNSHLRSP